MIVDGHGQLPRLALCKGKSTVSLKKTCSVTLNALLAIPYGNDLLVASNHCIQIQVLIEQRGVGEPNQFSVADGGQSSPLPASL